MKNYSIAGIQQIGIGVKNLGEAWKWYIDHFGMDCRIFEDEAEAKLMLPYTGGEPRKRHAVLALNLQSGGGFEIWQYKGREPLPLDGEISPGDLGILACKIKVKNIDEAYKFYSDRKVTLSAEMLEDPAGEKTFFVKDPYGNLFQMVERNSWFMNENKISGGSYGAMIGVSDIDRALPVYSDILGYDEISYDHTGTFTDLAGLPGGSGLFRRVLLKRSQPVTGPFSKVFGPSEIELIASSGKPGRKIFEGRYWGDLGFIHLCFDISNMDELKSYSTAKGFPFTVDSKESHEGNSFDMGEAAGHFSYITDPDGTLIEFVETHRIPLLKKLGWYLNLKKRDPHKSLPDWMVKTLRFSKVKT
ncbi:MAG TPA: VOC family protein [Bacteroidales bacterium]|nr:VOC family protein [Bacteroidales bacterium]HPF03472.1 VOC family protein [Bacteroidales bacterium]HPJ60396.1 VOC family protein [Bacteroidales bacterium]HPR12744.1 VOC family protein [Bacteroidales bacterium]HRW86750.1 VOC family protein [Bacteroidales bacterium]